MFATTYFFKRIWLLVVVSALYWEVGILSVALLHLVLSLPPVHFCDMEILS